MARQTASSGQHLTATLAAVSAVILMAVQVGFPIPKRMRQLCERNFFVQMILLYGAAYSATTDYRVSIMGVVIYIVLHIVLFDPKTDKGMLTPPPNKDEDSL
jgi:uncharacterized membrane protein SirB2